VARQQPDESTATEHDEETGSTRPADVDELWAAARIDVVEIALPGGVGYTLRAYRSEDDVETTDISEREGRSGPMVLLKVETTYTDQDDEKLLVSTMTVIIR